MTITLGEGNTPLVRSRRIGPAAGLPNLYFKLESCNPTGSYKDRFAAAAVSGMLATGKRRCVATSSGNTGAALAAYCAAADIPCAIAVVESAPVGKLSQMLAYGARLLRVRGFGPDPAITARVFDTLAQLGNAPDAALQISAYRYSPVGMAGVESISHELTAQAAQLGTRIDHVFVPAGGGGLTLAVARGFQIQTDEPQSPQSAQTVAFAHPSDPPRSPRPPRFNPSPAIHCVQPIGNDTIATPLRDGSTRARAVTCTSRISGLQVPSVIDGDQVIAACRASGSGGTSGGGHVITDDQAWDAQRRLAREEGIFAEPAAAVALAGLLANAPHFRGSTVVCLITGSGFKDPASVDAMTREQTVPLIDAGELVGRLES